MGECLLSIPGGLVCRCTINASLKITCYCSTPSLTPTTPDCVWQPTIMLLSQQAMSCTKSSFAKFTLQIICFCAKTICVICTDFMIRLTVYRKED